MATPYNYSPRIPSGPTVTPLVASVQSRPGNKLTRPPIQNPYNKFNQNEFDSWIGGITSALRKALGQEDEAESATEREVSVSVPEDQPFAYKNIDIELGQEDDSIIEDSFADLKNRRSKGKARDPREGPGLYQEHPIEFLSDNEDEELGKDNIFSDDNWDTEKCEPDEEEEQEDEAGHLEAEDLTGSPRSQYSQDASPSPEYEYSRPSKTNGSSQPEVYELVDDDDDEFDGEYPDKEEEQETRNQPQNIGQSNYVEDGEEAVGDYDEYDGEPQEKDVGEGPYEGGSDLGDGEVGPRSSPSIEILDDHDEITQVTRESSSLSHQSLQYPEDDGDELQPIADDTSFPHLNEKLPGMQEVTIPDPWVGPHTYAEDFYAGGDEAIAHGVNLDPHSLEGRDAPMKSDVIFTTEERLPLDTLESPVELPDVWEGLQHYAEDFYAGGDFNMNMGDEFNPHQLEHHREMRYSPLDATGQGADEPIIVEDGDVALEVKAEQVAEPVVLEDERPVHEEELPAGDKPNVGPDDLFLLEVEEVTEVRDGGEDQQGGPELEEADLDHVAQESEQVANGIEYLAAEITLEIVSEEVSRTSDDLPRTGVAKGETRSHSPPLPIQKKVTSDEDNTEVPRRLDWGEPMECPEFGEEVRPTEGHLGPDIGNNQVDLAYTVLEVESEDEQDAGADGEVGIDVEILSTSAVADITDLGKANGYGFEVEEPAELSTTHEILLESISTPPEVFGYTPLPTVEQSPRHPRMALDGEGWIEVEQFDDLLPEPSQPKVLQEATTALDKQEIVHEEPMFEEIPPSRDVDILVSEGAASEDALKGIVDEAPGTPVFEVEELTTVEQVANVEEPVIAEEVLRSEELEEPTEDEGILEVDELADDEELTVDELVGGARPTVVEKLIRLEASIAAEESIVFDEPVGEHEPNFVGNSVPTEEPVVVEDLGHVAAERPQVEITPPPESAPATEDIKLDAEGATPNRGTPGVNLNTNLNTPIFASQEFASIDDTLMTGDDKYEPSRLSPMTFRSPSFTEEPKSETQEDEPSETNVTYTPSAPPEDLPTAQDGKDPRYGSAVMELSSQQIVSAAVESPAVEQTSSPNDTRSGGYHAMFMGDLSDLSQSPEISPSTSWRVGDAIPLSPIQSQSSSDMPSMYRALQRQVPDTRLYADSYPANLSTPVGITNAFESYPANLSTPRGPNTLTLGHQIQPMPAPPILSTLDGSTLQSHPPAVDKHDVFGPDLGQPPVSPAAAKSVIGVSAPSIERVATASTSKDISQILIPTQGLSTPAKGKRRRKGKQKSTKTKEKDGDDDFLPDGSESIYVKPRNQGKEKEKKEGAPTLVQDTQKATAPPSSASIVSGSSASSAARLLQPSSRASSVASTAQSETSGWRSQASPTVYKPPANPPLPTIPPPSLFHAHGKKRKQQPLTLTQSYGPSHPPRNPFSRLSDRSSPLSPTTPSAETNPPPPPTNTKSGTKRSHTWTSSPVPITRSHCRFHKISIPKDEDGPRVFFIVPGCSLTKEDTIEDEDIIDHGDATYEDSRRMVDNVQSLGFKDDLVRILRLLVGADDREIFYLPQEGEVISRTPAPVARAPVPSTSRSTMSASSSVFPPAAAKKELAMVYGSGTDSESPEDDQDSDYEETKPPAAKKARRILSEKTTDSSSLKPALEDVNTIAVGQSHSSYPRLSTQSEPSSEVAQQFHKRPRQSGQEPSTTTEETRPVKKVKVQSYPTFQRDSPSTLG